MSPSTRTIMHNQGVTRMPSPALRPAVATLMLALACLLPAVPRASEQDTTSARMSVTIEGVDPALAEATLEAMPSAVRCEDPAWVASYHLRRVAEQLRQLLRTRAHYAPEIRQRLIRLPCWQGRLEVEPGPVTRITTSDIRVTGSGADTPALRAVLAGHDLRPGRVLDEGAYNDVKDDLARLARAEGYFDAEFLAQRIDVYPDRAAADIDLHQDTGDRYLFGDMDIDMQGVRIDRDVIERFIAIEPGTPYSADAVQRTRRALTDTGVFRSVDVVTMSPERTDGRVPMRTALRARKRHQFSSGVGYATDYGPRLSLGYENRYATPRMHQIAGHVVASKLLTQVGGDYRMPIVDGGDPWLAIGGRWKREETNSWLATSYSVGARHLADGPFGFRMTEAVQLLYEDYDVGGERRDATLTIPSLLFSRARQTGAAPLESGWRIEARIRGALEPLASASFVQASLTAEAAVRLGERQRVIGRTRLGTTGTPELDALPPSLRFFTGGDNQVRGYAYGSEGPRNSSGLVIGGRHVAEFSVEVERMMSPRWGLAAFADTGSAFDTELGPWVTGVGVGLRLHTPLGPIRVDLAHPLDADRGLRVHLGIGTRYQ